jgi:hypothetical protein
MWPITVKMGISLMCYFLVDGFNDCFCPALEIEKTWKCQWLSYCGVGTCWNHKSDVPICEGKEWNEMLRIFCWCVFLRMRMHPISQRWCVRPVLVFTESRYRFPNHDLQKQVVFEVFRQWKPKQSQRFNSAWIFGNETPMISYDHAGSRALWQSKGVFW